MGMSVRELSAMVGGELRGDGAVEVACAAPLDAATPDAVVFVADARQAAKLPQCVAAAALVPPGVPEQRFPTIVVAKPFDAMLMVAARLRPPPAAAPPGIDPRAAIAATATIGAGVSVGPFAVIEDGVVVGPRCRIHAHAVLRAECVLAEDVEIHPHAVLYPRTRVGPRTVVHAGAVVGKEGFGFRPVDGVLRKVPQLGETHLGADVEIGANTCIDRATLGATVVGDHSKIDNQVQVGHNCRIGARNVIVAHVGLGGSCVTEENVTLAGKVGVADHVRIGAGATVGADAGVPSDLAGGVRYLGTPARPENLAKRMLVALERLPEMRTELREVRRHLGLEAPATTYSTAPTPEPADPARRAG